MKNWRISLIFVLLIFTSSCLANPTKPESDTPQPICTAFPTYTVFPSPTPPNEEWLHYKIRYAIILDDFRGSTKVWMPLPVNSITQKNVRILEVSPTPADIYFEAKGNQIVFWN